MECEEFEKAIQQIEKIIPLQPLLINLSCKAAYLRNVEK